MAKKVGRPRKDNVRSVVTCSEESFLEMKQIIKELNLSDRGVFGDITIYSYVTQAIKDMNAKARDMYEISEAV